MMNKSVLLGELGYVDEGQIKDDITAVSPPRPLGALMRRLFFWVILDVFKVRFGRTGWRVIVVLQTDALFVSGCKKFSVFNTAY